MRVNRDALVSVFSVLLFTLAPEAESWAQSGSQSSSEDESEKSGSNEQLEEIVVFAKFIDLTATGATKLPLAIAEIPQSVTLVSSGFIDSTNTTNTGELADYLPGLSQTGQVYNFRPSIKSRGFGLGNLYGFKMNGYRYSRTADFNSYLFERIESIRGPSSSVYGIGNPGGLINYVLRSPGLETEGQFDVEVGSWDRIGGRVRHGGPINESGSFRGLLMAAGQQRDDNMDFYFSSDQSIAAVIEYDVSDDLSLRSNFIKEKRKSRAADGVPLFSSDGSAPPVPRSTFLGNRDTDESNQIVTFGSLEADWILRDDLRLGMNLASQKTDFDVTLTFPFNVQDNGDTNFRSFEFFAIERTKNAEIFAEWTPTFWGREQAFRLAAAYDERTSESLNRSASVDGEFAITANIFGTAEDIYNVVSDFKFEGDLFAREFESTSSVLNLQAVLRPLDRASLILGIAFNDATSSSQVGSAVTDFEFPNEPSYRLGITYAVTDNLNAYATWSDSFTPQTILDINGRPLEPLKGEQIEVGVKMELFANQLLLSGSVFEITQKNSPRLIPGVTPERFETFGEVEHSGWEIEAIGQITSNWKVFASVDGLDPVVKISDDPAQIGPTRPFIPTFNASMFSSYRFDDGLLQGLTMGAGVRHMGELHTDFTGSRMKVADWTVADALIAYEVDERTAIRLNINNLFDETYRLATYDSIFFGLRFGDPRNYLLTLSRLW